MFNFSSNFKPMRYLVLFICLWTSITQAQPQITSHSLPSGYTTSQLRIRNQLKIDASGNKWVAFSAIGLAKYDGTSWIVYDSLNSGLPTNNITSLDFVANGNIWIGTNMGAVFYDGIIWQFYNSGNTGVPLQFVNSVTVDGAVVWFGTNEGVVKFDGTNWSNYNEANSGLPNDTVKKIIFPGNGKLWIATKQGVCVYDGSTWNTFNSANSILPVNDIFDILDDAYNRIWISSNASNAIFYIEGDSVVKNFHGTIYNEQLELTTGKIRFGRDDVKNIYFITSTINQAIVKIQGTNCDFFYLSPNFLYPGFALGHCMAFDNLGSLWYLQLYSSSIDSLKEINFWGYQPQPLLTPTIYNAKSLDINDVNALILNRGDMHWDPSDLNDGRAYEVPKGSGKHASYASALWIGGLDAGGTLRVAAQSYRQTGTDYWPGPISGISQPFDSSSCVQFDKIYEVYKWQIEEFKTNFLNGSVSNGSYPVPMAILEWPSTGNYGITDDKAPFVDFNNDNLYNPYDGDYPLIKGDQMLFWMFNDSLAEHNNTDPGRLGVEVHSSAYAYSCPGIADSNQVLNRTTLYNYRIINRSVRDYHDVHLGLWNSSVIGYFSDNYMGCDTMLASGFAYNADNDDEILFGGYGLNPPMNNVVVLRGMEADANDGVDNNLNGIADEPGERTTMNHFITADNGPNGSPTGNPNGDLDHYRYMQSIWLDGQHLTYGGDGRDVSSPSTNFMFPGMPYTLEWNEFAAGNLGGEQKYVLGSGPVSLPAGGEISIDFAYVFTWDSLSPNGVATSIARNTQDVQRVHSWFDNDNFPSCLVYSVGEEELQNENQQLKIYPNPTTDIVYFDVKSVGKNDVVEVRDITGRLVLTRQNGYDSKIDVSQLRDGLYTLRLIRKNSVFTGKFLKM